MSYPDIEALLVAWGNDNVDARFCTELPADLATALPVVRVTRIAGVDKDVRLDVPLVDIDCFAADGPAARALCEAVRSELLDNFTGALFLAPVAPSTTPTPLGATVARVQTVQGPHRRPYDNTNVRRYGATLRITLHS